MSRKLSQQKRILEYLQAGRTLTTLEAVFEIGTTKLPTRIAELIEQGYDIHKEWVFQEGGVKFIRYSIAKA